jgi:DNA-binding winged helix-turn-helix (wHTH) protein
MTTGTLAVLPTSFRTDGSRPLYAAEPRIPAASNLHDDAELAFGDFLFVPRSRVLLRSGRPVCLGSRAFDLLHALLKSAGRLVAKEDLVKQVWPSTFVDESNLRFQMACLRKALGGDRNVIKTVPGRGYIFTGRCTRADCRLQPAAESQGGGAARGTDEDCRSTRLPAVPAGFGGAGTGPDSRQGRHGFVDLASMSIVRARSERPAGLPADAPSSALQDPCGAQQPPVTLLLPMIVLSGGHLDESGAEGFGPTGTLEAIELGALLELLRTGLDRGRND